MTKDIQKTAENIVRNDVHYCISTLISELASPEHETSWLGGMQAKELFYPVQDWESAAIDHGMSKTNNGRVYDLSLIHI